MRCHQCKASDCSCSTFQFQKAQRVVGHHVVLHCRTVCADACLHPDDDLLEVISSNVTLTLPCAPTPCKSYRVLATQGEVTVVDAEGNFVTTVPNGSSLDLTFSSDGRWIAACCGSVDDLEALIGPQGVAGLLGAIGPAGVAGLVGAIGPAGVAGLVGGIGPQGIAGLIGQIGLTGLTGLTGAIGAAGVAGLTGAIGVQGVAGLVGAMGPEGIAGIVGPQGIQGIPGVAGVSEFAYVYNLTSRVVPIEADVLLDFNGPITAGITHAPGSAAINIVNAGIYEVDFIVSGVEPAQFALTVNGVPDPSTVYGSGAGTQLTTGHAILMLGAGNVLTIRNHSSAAAVTLQPNAGGTQANVNASIVIKKL